MPEGICRGRCVVVYSGAQPAAVVGVLERRSYVSLLPAIVQTGEAIPLEIRRRYRKLANGRATPRCPSRSTGVDYFSIRSDEGYPGAVCPPLDTWGVVVPSAIVVLSGPAEHTALAWREIDR